MVMSLSVENVVEKHALHPEEVKALIVRRKHKRLMRRIARANRLTIQRFMTMSRGRKRVPVTMLGGLL